jgi:hypothetical protein
MKTMTLLFAVVVAVFLAAAPASAENKYVGIKMCGACHKVEKTGAAYTIWEKSKHANAFKTLETAEAKAVAAKKGIKGNPAEAKECLKCHVTGGGTAANVDAKFDPKEGVTCEACHGAASGYRMIHNKPENKAKAIAAGLIVTKKDDAKPCEKCHNAESPTFKGFKMGEMWAKIAHALPKK